MKRYIIGLIVASIFLSTAAPLVAAQEGTVSDGANETAPPGAPDDVELVVDDNIALVSHSFDDGVLTMRFYTSQTKTIAVAPEIDSQAETGTSSGQTHILEGNSITAVQVESTGGATFWTQDSLTDVQFHWVRKPPSGIVSGPFTGRDVGIAALAGALAVSSCVLYGAVLARLGDAEEGGRIA